jgi:hypothetical protein
VSLKSAEDVHLRKRFYWSYVYKECIACFTVYIISVFPETCHEPFKEFVQFICGVVFIFGPFLLLLNPKLDETLKEILVAIQVGGFFSFLTWLTVLLVCTDRNRVKYARAVKKIPLIGDIIAQCICCSSDEIDQADELLIVSSNHKKDDSGTQSAV